MRAIRLIGEIDDRHQLHADVPKELRTGKVRVILLVPEEEDEDEADAAWSEAVANWSSDFDKDDDLYTLDDGWPVDL